jgi:hypothetical protein
MPRKLNEGCKNYQDGARQKTINEVQNAISRLKEEGAIVTVGKLMELTGLARSTFSKSHIDDLFKKNRVCKYENKTVIVQEENNSKLAEKLEKELEKSNKLVTKLTQELEKQKEKHVKLQADYIKKDEDYQLLLGKWHTLVKKAKLLGINILE